MTPSQPGGRLFAPRAGSQRSTPVRLGSILRMADLQDRYARQALFHEIGRDGQRRIESARVAIVGIGALGCQEAALLARAGIGHLRLIDRDFVEASNLQRQILFDEADAARGAAKATAARAQLLRVNSSIEIEACVADLDAGNAAALLGDADVIVDGSDNFEVRFLINDFAVSRGIPWVYAAAVGATGLTMAILPGATACLRCLFEEPPPPGSQPTCDTAGVLAPATSAVGALAALEALKIAAGRPDAVRRGLLQLELWHSDVREIAIDQRREDCPCCGGRTFPFLAPRAGSASTQLCGRDAVQVRPAAGAAFDFEAVRQRLAAALPLQDGSELLRFAAGNLSITLFRDGRAIVKGTHDEDAARSVYARFIGT